MIVCTQFLPKCVCLSIRPNEKFKCSREGVPLLIPKIHLGDSIIIYATICNDKAKDNHFHRFNVYEIALTHYWRDKFQCEWG